MFRQRSAATVISLVMALGALSATVMAQDAAAPDLARSSVGGHMARLVDVGGIQARYYEAGAGEPLILLHGGRRTVFNSANMWTRNITGLARRYHVFAVDRLGYGMTGAPPGSTFSYQEEVAFLRDFIDTMKLGRVHVAGNSSGAAVALLFGLTHPDRAGTLILVGIGPHTPRADSGSKGAIMREACGNIADPVQSWSCWMEAMTYRHDVTFDTAFFAASEYMKSLPQWTDIEARKAAAPRQGLDYWRPHMARIREEGLPRLPILLVCGKHDSLDWEAGSRVPGLKGCLGFYDIIGARNDRVKLIVYNHAGHFPYREYPDQFNGDVANFIDFWSRGDDGHD